MTFHFPVCYIPPDSFESLCILCTGYKRVCIPIFLGAVLSSRGPSCTLCPVPVPCAYPTGVSPHHHGSHSAACSSTKHSRVTQHSHSAPCSTKHSTATQQSDITQPLCRLPEHKTHYCITTVCCLLMLDKNAARRNTHTCLLLVTHCKRQLTNHEYI